MAKTILDLPSELIASIVTYLEDRDVFATRSAAKVLERASFSHFGKRFFRKKGYMLTTPSLNVLQGVAAHPELRKWPQHVWFNPDCFTFIHPDCAPDPEETPEAGHPESLVDLLSPADRKMYQAYEACMTDHVSLIAKTAAKLQSILREAFRQLPNLKIIGMRRSEDHSPWGWRALQDAVGQDPRVLGPIPSGPMYLLSTPTRLFVALVNAVAASGVTLRRFYTDAIELDNIRPDLLPQHTLDKACSPIWYLEVNVMRGWLNTRHHADYITPGHPKWQPGAGLTRLLRACSSLKELGLQIFPDRQSVSHRNISPRDRFLDAWPYQSFARLMHALPAPRLDRVKLEKLVTAPAHLLALLHPSQTSLTSLKLRDVRLVSADPADPAPPRPWEPLFAFLSEHCPHLTCLLLHHLLYAHGGVSFVQDIQPAPLPPAADDDALTAQPADLSPAAGWHTTSPHFTDYENITVHVQGRAAVRARLAELPAHHWYQKPVFTYAMDDTVWHTDTSEEEW